MRRFLYPLLLLALALSGCARSSTTMTEAGAAGGGVDAGMNADVATVPLEAGSAEADRIIGTNTSSANTILENARAIPSLSNFVEAVQAAGLEDTLSGAGPYTVFAPTNQAFDLVDKDELDTMMSEDEREQFEALLLSHVTEGETTYGELNDGTTVVMLSGADLNIARQSNDQLTKRIGEAEIIVYDIESSNGVIHVVNLVLDPEGFWSQM